VGTLQWTLHQGRLRCVHIFRKPEKSFYMHMHIHTHTHKRSEGGTWDITFAKLRSITDGTECLQHSLWIWQKLRWWNRQTTSIGAHSWEPGHKETHNRRHRVSTALPQPDQSSPQHSVIASQTQDKFVISLILLQNLVLYSIFNAFQNCWWIIILQNCKWGWGNYLQYYEHSLLRHSSMQFHRKISTFQSDFLDSPYH
jgi:hypothetical protein